MKNFSITLYFISCVFLGMGFHKLYKYDSSSYEPVNAYVGGDAYNYIINMGFATSLFIVALILSMVATGVLIYSRLNAVYTQLGGDLNKEYTDIETVEKQLNEARENTNTQV
jgi:hypothetical protein